MANNDYQAKFGADGSQFNQGINAMLGALNKLDKETMGVGPRIADAFKSPSAILATAAAAVGAGFAYMAKTSIDAADKLGENAQKVGVSAAALSKLEYAAKMSGVETETLQTGLTKLSVKLSDAAKSGGKNAEAFQSLGVNIKNVDGSLKTSDQVLSDVAGKFASMPDGVHKTAAAVDVFGKSGAQLIPLLNQGASGIKQLTDEAKSMGLEITDNTARAAGDFNDSLDRLKYVGVGISNQVMADLMPAFSNLGQVFTDTATNGDIVKNASELISGAFKGLGTAAIGAYGAVSALGTIWGTVGAEMAAFATLNFDMMDDIFANGEKKLKESLNGTVAMIKALWSTTETDEAKAARTAIRNVAGNIDEVDKNAKKAKKTLTEIFGSEMVAKQNIGMLTILTKTNIAMGELTFMADQSAKAFENLGKAIPKFESVNLFDTGTIGYQQMINELDSSNAELLATQGIMADESRAAYSNMFGDMSAAAANFYDVTGQKSAEFFAISKAFQIGQATMATYESAVNAFNSLSKIPFVGPYLGAAAAAAAVTFGISNVAKIAATQPGGSVSGGGAISLPGNSGAVNMPSVAPSTGGGSRTVNITIYGNVVDQDRFARELIPSIQRAINDGVSLQGA